MSYKAYDIAKYIITRCTYENKEITHVKLQKMLYYIQGAFFAELGHEAFSDEIYAWQHGPVVASLYRTFSIFGSGPIRKVFELYELPEFKIDEINIINQVISEKINIYTWDLVHQTHKEDPWKYANKSFGEGSLIHKDSIKRYFEGNKWRREKTAVTA